MEQNGFGHIDTPQADTDPPAPQSALEILEALDAEYAARREALDAAHVESLERLNAEHAEKREGALADAVNELRAIEEQAKVNEYRTRELRKVLKLSGRPGPKGPAKARPSQRPPRIEDGLEPTDRIFAFLQHNEPSRVAAIAEGTGLDPKVVSRACKALVQEKRAKSKGKARGTTYEAVQS